MIVLCRFLSSSYSGHFCSKISGTVLGFKKLFTISPIVSFFKNNEFVIPIPLAVVAVYIKADECKSGTSSLKST